MSAPYLIKAIESLIVALPETHKRRIMDAVKHGDRVSIPDIAHAKKVHRLTVWRWIKEGKLPTPRKDGRRLNTWSYDEVAEFMQ